MNITSSVQIISKGKYSLSHERSSSETWSNAQYTRYYINDIYIYLPHLIDMYYGYVSISIYSLLLRIDEALLPPQIAALLERVRYSADFMPKYQLEVNRIQTYRYI